MLFCPLGVSSLILVLTEQQCPLEVWITCHSHCVYPTEWVYQILSWKLAFTGRGWEVRSTKAWGEEWDFCVKIRKKGKSIMVSASTPVLILNFPSRVSRLFLTNCLKKYANQTMRGVNAGSQPTPDWKSILWFDICNSCARFSSSMDLCMELTQAVCMAASLHAVRNCPQQELRFHVQLQ